jgi:hypothetical protein
MSMMAEAHFARHRDELINKAAADVATFPEFSRYRVLDDTGKVSVECKMTQAIVWADKGKPDTDNPNCSLDLDTSEYS